MSQEYSVEVKDITKVFRVYMDKGYTFKEKIIFGNRRKFEERRVLDGISFKIKKGEAVGLIGHNGCGKSTTLKLLTRIMYPDSGAITVKGRVSSLIELGAGFHPDMSGRENIYINASIFGLTRKEIDARLDDIIDFSELRDFIDNPVRTYSSGMYMRLAFSVAINVRAEVLLIDEILAVGDVNFQVKCFEKLEEIKKTGTTIVIVSHSLDQIERICDRTIWIENGKIEAEGNPHEVHGLYLQSMERVREANDMKVKSLAEGGEIENKGVVRRGNKKLEFTKIYYESSGGKNTRCINTGDNLKFVLEYYCRQKIEDGVFGIEIYKDNGILCFGTNTYIELRRTLQLEGAGRIEIVMPDINLMEGNYTINLAAHSPEMFQIYDYIYSIISFTVVNKKNDIGICRMKTEWYADEKLLNDN